MDELQEKLLPFFKEHGVAVVLGAAGLLCLGYGLIAVNKPQDAKNNDFQNLPEKQSSVRNPISPISKDITIDIEGAVEKPGVYALPANSRMQNALIAAGGLSQDADRHLVAQNLNLAAALTDGVKLYIPAVGEQIMTSGNTSSGTSGSVQGISSKMVNINQAAESDLDALPGVGPVTAQKIIDNRPYQNVQELLDKKVVGQSVFTKIKEQISVY